MVHIGFLHTSAVHVTPFTDLVASESPAAKTTHSVRDDLLDRAVAEGIGPEIEQSVFAELDELRSAGADVVVCTCSTLGAVAERRGEHIVRIDRPMIEAACSSPGRIAVLYAVESTREPTTELVASVAKSCGQDVTFDLQLVDGAWDHFLAGDQEVYLEAIQSHIEALAPQFTSVVLAQTSMAKAAEQADTDLTVYSSARPAVTAALQLVDRI